MDETELLAFSEAFRRLSDDVHALAPPSEQGQAFVRALREHLGDDPTTLPVVEQQFAGSEHPNVQLAMEELAGPPSAHLLLGIPAEAQHWGGLGLTSLAAPREQGPRFDPVAPVYVNVSISVDETLPCLSLGVWLVQHRGAPVAVLQDLGDPHRGRNQGVRLEAMSPDRDTATDFLAEVSRLVVKHNVYRGKVVSFTFDHYGNFGLEFHRLPTVTRDDLILPDKDLEALERHTLGIVGHADRLRAAGRHLKRGLLLYGPPGTGKTYSVMYLRSQMPDRTTILLTGQAAPTIGQAAAIARTLQPSMLVLEDVDLVAMERTMPGRATNPLLFQLLNEMDGLEEDADVIFVLTTNRVDLLEPALAARPGRIDQAIEIGLPDDDARRRLLERYLEGIADPTVEIDALVASTEGASAAYLKELVRRAAHVAADAGIDPIRVRTEHLDVALAEIVENSTPLLQRLLGAGRDEELPPE